MRDKRRLHPAAVLALDGHKTPSFLGSAPASGSAAQGSHHDLSLANSVKATRPFCLRT
jgi:hypothetical protein